MPLEDLRDAWGPARVLHTRTELAGIAATGPHSARSSRHSTAARSWQQLRARSARALRERRAA